ncbi:MAG: SdpI family protein [Clostridia bacterium]|nr:SdpI family protein [Clostridia bacterium]
MIKNNKLKTIFSSLIILLPIVIGLIFWNKLPNGIPIHFDVNNNVDGTIAKWIFVFIFPIGLVTLHLLSLLLTGLDPKFKNIDKKNTSVIFIIIPLLSLLVSAVSYSMALGLKINVAFIVMLVLGALFIIIGNYIPKIRQNFSLGIKLPWTLNDEDNWVKTHRFAGVVWVIGGVIIMITSFLSNLFLFIGITLALVIIPTIYSYVYYAKNKKDDKN